MNPFTKRDQSEPAQATYVQPVASDSLETESLDSSLESTNAEAKQRALQEKEAVDSRASERYEYIERLEKNHRMVRYAMIAALLVSIGAVVFLKLHATQPKTTLSSVNQKYSTQRINLDKLSTDKNPVSNTSTNSVDVNGELHVNSSLILTPAPEPANAVAGQLYYDADTGELRVYNGESFNTIPSTNNVVTSLGGASGPIDVGAGLALVDNQIVNTGVQSISAGANIDISDDGAGNLTISSAVSGSIGSPGGTAGRLAKFVDGQTIADSLLSESGLAVTVNGSLNVTGSLTLSTALSVSQGGTGLSTLSANQLLFASSANSIGQLGNGAAGQCLLSNGAGSAPSFQVCPGGGGGVTSLNGQSGVVTIANASGASGVITINDAAADGTTKGIASFSASNFTATSGDISIKTGGVTSSEIADGTVTNADLTTGTFSNITGVGILSAGSIASGFGSIVTTNTITGSVVNGTTSIRTGAGAGTTRIDSSGNLTNIGTINTSGLITGGNGLTISAGTVTLSGLTGGASTCLTLNGSSQVGTATCATGTGSTPTLQNVYDNSGATPNILLASLGGGITIQDAAVSVGGNLLAVKNNAGTTTYLGVTTTGTSINGNISATGSVTFSSLGTGVAVLNSGALSSSTINLGSLPAYISGTLPVGNGGTGASSFANTNGVIYYDGSKLAVSNVGTTGQCLLATTGSAPSFGTCTGAGGVSSITATTTQTGALTFNGTPNQVSVTNSGSTFTFSTPQSIATTSDVQFNSVNATTLLKTNGVTRIDASGNLSNIGTISTSGLITAGNGITVSAGTVTLNNLTGGSSTCLTLDALNHVGTATCATGSGSTPTLQNVYDNSGVSPNIVLASTGGGITIQDAATTVGGNLLAVKDNAGTTTYLGVTTSGAAVTGSFSVSSNVTLSSLSGGAAANQCLTTNAGGQLILTSCLGGGGGGSGGVVSLNGLSGSISLANASTAGSTITIDDASTAAKGIASFASGNFAVTSGAVSIKTGGVTTTEIADGTIANADLAGGTYSSITGTGALTAGSIASGFGTIATVNTITGTTLNGTTGINTGAGAGTQRIDSSGNLANIGTISTSGLITGGNGLTISAGTITLNNLVGGAGQCLTLNASSIVGVSTCATGAGTTPTLQNVYDNSTTTPNIILTATGGGIKIQDAASTVGNLFSVTNSGGGTNYLNITASGLSAAGTITFSGLASATGGVVFANAGGALSVTSNAGTTGDCLLSNGSGSAPSFATCPGNSALPTNGIANDNTISKFTTGATQLTNSQITDDGVRVSIGGSAGAGLFNVGATNQFQVSSAGAVTAVGLNGGTGLIQGSGGLTINGGTITLSSLSSGTASSCLVLDASNIVRAVTCAAGTGTGTSGSYIQNQNASAQTAAVFWISGAGRSDTSFLAPTFDAATGVALNIGTSNATAVGIGKVGVTTTINGPLTSTGLITGNSGITTSGGAFSIIGNAGSSLSTTSGGLNVQGAGTVNVTTTNAGTSTSGITIRSGSSSSNTAGTVYIDTGTSNTGTSLVNIGTANAGEVHVGSGSNAIKLDSSITVASSKSFTLASGNGTFNQTYVNNTGSAQTTAAANNTVGGTVNAITINASGTNVTGSNTVNALNFGNASNGAGGTTTFNGLNFGTGYDNILSSSNASITGAGALSLGAGSSTGSINVANNSATTTLSVTSSATPTTALIVANDTSGVTTDKLISLQAGGTPKFTVDASGNVVALGTYNTNTFNSTTLTFGGASTATISSNGANVLNLDTGAAAALNLGTANSNAVNISKSGVTTTINGAATIGQLLTANAGLNISSGSTFANASSTLNIVIALGNLATGPIGANTATVDVSTAFTINPSASGRSYTIPSPTNTAAGRIIYVSNISGSFSFDIGGVTVPAGANAGFLWNGSSWAASNVSTGASVVGALNGGTANATGATISGNTLYLQSASATFAGLVDTANGQTFAGTKTFSSLLTAGAGFTSSGGAISLTGNAASSFTTSTGALTITSAAAATWGTSAGDLTIQANGTSNLNLGTSGAGTVNIGTVGSTNTNSTVHIADSSAAIQTVTIGSTSSTSSTLIQGGSGTVAGSEAIRIVPNAAGSVTIGGTNQSGAINLGVTTGADNTINIGNGAISANIQTINIGTGSTGTGKDVVTIGSLNDGSTTTLQAGTGGIISQLAANASNVFVLQNNTQSLSSTGQLATFGTNNSTTNLITNPSFENTPMAGTWSAKGSSTVTKHLGTTNGQTTAYTGSSDGKVVTTAAVGDGIKQNISLAIGTYTVSFYAKLDAASAAMNNDMVFGFFNGTDETTYASSTQTVTTAGWTRYSATFSVASVSGTPYFYVKQTDAAVHTFYVDQVQVESGSNASGQGIGALQLNSLIVSPVILQNTVNSTNAFSIFDASGNIVFGIDTINRRVVFGTGVTSAHGKYITLTPEYTGAVLDAAGDGSCSGANNGTMTSGFDSAGTKQNYYQWVSGAAATNCYDVVVAVPIPADFLSWGAGPTIYAANSASLANSICLQILNTTGAADSAYASYSCQTPGASITNLATFATPTSSYAATAGNTITFKIRMTSNTTTSLTKLGNISIPYTSSY